MKGLKDRVVVRRHFQYENFVFKNELRHKLFVKPPVVPNPGLPNYLTCELCSIRH